MPLAGPLLLRVLQNKLIDRQQEESIQTANLDGLVSCPKPDCGYAKMMENELDKVFHCEKCDADTCRLCKEDWKGHFGLKCEEVENGSATAARRKIEEAMTAASKRECYKWPVNQRNSCLKTPMFATLTPESPISIQFRPK
jgi:hypothetical protein